MAAGTWDDFTDKYGFNDGAQLEQRDFDARKNLVALLNTRPEMQAAKVRALEFDRGGFHNSCLIVLVPAVERKSDAELMADWMAGPGDEAALPEFEDDEDGDPLMQMVEEAYNAVDAAPALAPSRPLTSRELATVLHALRSMQENQRDDIKDACAESCDHFDDGDTPLTSEEIDELCESINLAPPSVQTPPRVVVVLEGGAVTGILSTQPVEVAVIDYDTEGAEAEDLARIPQNDAEPFAYADAYTTLYPVEMKPERTAQLFAAVQDHVITR